MALARSLFVVLLSAALPLLFLSLTSEAGEMGVNWGRVAKNLPDPAVVTQLLKQNGITMVKIYDANATVLKSLANTGIKVMVMVPNENVADVASNPSVALDWVQNNVAAHVRAGTRINGVAVGNEVFALRRDLNSQLVPAMKNVQAALDQLGLAGGVKVSTPIAFSAVTDSYPPSAGRFVDELVPVMTSMLQFLQETGSDLTMNLYPYFAYVNDPGKIPLAYALGNYEPGVQDGDLVYHSLLDAMLDATYYAMEKLGFSASSENVLAGANDNRGVKQSTGETAYPSGGKGIHGGRRLAEGDGSDAATVANAQAYTHYVTNRVLSGRTGTPHRPDADMDVYIFELFNENNKGTGSDDIEQNFGLFYPNMTKVYEFDFVNPGPPPAAPTPAPMSWCVANAAVGDARLKTALDYACANGADCSAIQPGASCFQPNTMVAHASYAFNSYYQNKNRFAGACDFNGAASVVYQKPADTCGIKPMSWCVANAAVGDARLKTALDYACAHGADCSAIQPGASCFQPNTMVAHASYAFNSYYQNKGRASGTCDFAGAGSVVNQQPANTCGMTARTWCVANSAVGEARLQTALDWACANGADCSAIQARGPCFDPNTKVAHASYAFNSYYQRKNRAPGTCDFSGAASIVNQAPRFGNCVLPSNA